MLVALCPYVDMGADIGSAVWGYGFGRVSAEEELEEVARRRGRGRLVVEVVGVYGNRVAVRLKNAGGRAVGWGDRWLSLRLYRVFKEPRRERFLLFEVIKRAELVGKATIDEGLAPGEEKIVEVEARCELAGGEEYRLDVVEVASTYEEELLARVRFDPAGVKYVVVRVPRETYLELMKLCSEEGVSLPELLDKLVERYRGSKGAETRIKQSPPFS